MRDADLPVLADCVRSVDPLGPPDLTPRICLCSSVCARMASVSDIVRATHEEHSWSSVWLVALLLVSVACAAALRRYKVTSVVPESTAAIAVGFVAGALMSLGSSPTQQVALSFNAEFVFFAVLPFIILDAGYTVHRSDLFANLGAISVLAILGTIVNTLVFGYLMFAFAKAGWIPLASDSPLECLLYASALSATDPVAILSILGSPSVSDHTDPLLYSLVFGEAVVNDATAMVLFAVFAEASSKAGSFGAGQLFLAILQCVGVSLASVLFGVAIALVCCFCLRRLAVMRECAVPSPTHQLIVVTLVAYASWSLADLAGLSSVLSLFFTALTLAHYNTDNLTIKGRIVVSDAFKAMAAVAETGVFGWIGVTAGLALGSASEMEWHTGLIVLTLATALVARAVNIFPLCAIVNLSRDRIVPGVPVDPMRKVISPDMQVSLWLSGMRGPVSFMLVSTVGVQRGLMLASTLVLVLVSTVGGGSLVIPMLRCTGMYRTSAAEPSELPLPASPVSSDPVDVAELPVDSSVSFSVVLSGVASSPSLFERCAGRTRAAYAWLVLTEATTLRQWFGGVVGAVPAPHISHDHEPLSPQRVTSTRHAQALERMQRGTAVSFGVTTIDFDVESSSAVCVEVDGDSSASPVVADEDAAGVPAEPCVLSSVPLAVPL